VSPNGHADIESLNDRERTILRHVVRQFIETAAPVGSRALAEGTDMGLSSASIRNTMNALEAAGLLNQPHTSAGRIPTEMGYRAYVDELMGTGDLSTTERQILRQALDQRFGDHESLTRETSRLLGRLTRLLGVVLTPQLSTGTLERLEIVPVSSTRVLMVLAISGGLIRTILAEVDAEWSVLAERARGLDRIVSLLNERLAGLTLDEIRRTGSERVQDLDVEDETGVVRLVLSQAPNLFRDEPEARRAQVGGAENLTEQPEFQDADSVKGVLQLLGREEAMVQLLEDPASDSTVASAGRAVVRIGWSLPGQSHPQVRTFSIVSAPYHLGAAVGRVGVIGPTRMDYEHAVALVEFAATLLSETRS
jgi:heat-inducible transcriptional repressor